MPRAKAGSAIIVATASIQTKMVQRFNISFPLRIAAEGP
jgi:hypothetical protein